jgi:hypothetical protein
MAAEQLKRSLSKIRQKLLTDDTFFSGGGYLRLAATVLAQPRLGLALGATAPIYRRTQKTLKKL